MEYKGYHAVVQFDDDADIFHGNIIGTQDTVTFQGETVVDLKQAFRDSLESYLAVCAELGHQPSKPYSGQIEIRIAPDLHRFADEAAAKVGQTLDEWLADTVARAAVATLDRPLPPWRHVDIQLQTVAVTDTTAALAPPPKSATSDATPSAVPHQSAAGQ